MVHSFFESFYFVVKRLTALVSDIRQTLVLGEKTLDLSKRNVGSIPLDFLTGIFMNSRKNLLLANIRSLNLSHNNFEKLPDIFLQLINLTCLYVNDNRLSSLPKSMRSLKGLQELDLRNNQLKGLDVVRGLPKLKKLYVEGNPLTLEEIRSLIKHVEETTRTISVDIAGSVTCTYGNESFPYSSTMLSSSKDCVSLMLWWFLSSFRVSEGISLLRLELQVGQACLSVVAKRSKLVYVVDSRYCARPCGRGETREKKIILSLKTYEIICNYAKINYKVSCVASRTGKMFVPD